MLFDTIDIVALVAAIAGGFVFGAMWYGVLGKAWMKAAALDEGNTRPGPATMLIALSCQAVMAAMLAGIMIHSGGFSIRGGLISAVLIWIGFVLTTLIVNHRFQGRPWSLTVIDGGHWLGVLMIQGLALGALSPS